MDRIGIAIVGCGGMGRRHLRGLATLARTDFNNLNLLAVCDLNQQNAEDLADEAKELLGTRPRVFTDIATMAREVEGLQAADVTTETGAHHRAAIPCLENGLHVQCEKPLGITVRASNAIIEAAKRNGRILSVAENFRRDPINRLIRALIDDGAIGTPRMMYETTVGGGNKILITPWRHMRRTGTITLDEGVHHADIMQYYLGPVRSAYGEARLFEKVRYKTDSAGPGGFYAKWTGNFPDSIEPDGEDAIYGHLHFASGAIAHWVNDHAGHGRPLHQRLVYGSKGSLTCPGDRNGRPVTLHLDDGVEIGDERILDYAPSYRLSPLAAHLFGGERPWTYSFPFNETDWRIMALEYHELGECIRNGTQPEVTGEVGRAAVAIVYALFESGRLGRPVTIEELETVQVDAYQREIDQQLNLV